jgi:hypothetical protein
MKSIFKITTIFLVAALGTLPAFAAKKDKSQRDPAAALQKKIQKSDLPADVREKANKVIAEHGPKVREAMKAREAVLTSEQKTARSTAQKAAKEAGKKRKQAAADVAAALKLTDEQKSKYTAAEKDLASAQKALHSALSGVLTADQQAAIGLKARKKNKA